MKGSGNSLVDSAFIINLHVQNNIAAYIFFIAILGGCTWSLILGQDANWDIKNYHYYNPYSLLNDRLNYDIAPAQIQTYFNPTLDLIPFFLIQYFPPWVFGAVLGGWDGLNLWLMYIIGNILLTRIKFPHPILWAVLCAFVGMMGAATISEVGTTHHDLTLSVLILGSLLVYLQTMPSLVVRTQALTRRKLLASGLLLGLAVGLKLTLALYAIGMGIAVVWVELALLKRYGGLIILGSAAIAGFLITEGPWMWVLWKKFGNPFFPMYNLIFKSPYFLLENTLDARFLPKSFYEYLTFPLHFSLLKHAGCELSFNDIRIAILYLISLAVCAYLLVRFMAVHWLNLAVPPQYKIDYSVWWLFVFIWVSYIVWLKMFSVYRYLICLELLSPIALVVLVGSFNNSRKMRGLLFIVLAFILLTVRPPAWGRVPWGEDFFGVRPPPIETPANTVILISSDNAFSYLIPSFPSEVRFVRVEANFLNPKQSTALTESIKSILIEPGKNFYLLTDGAEVKHGVDVVNQYLRGRIASEAQCEPIKSRLDSTFVLCGLTLSQQ